MCLPHTSNLLYKTQRPHSVSAVAATLLSLPRVCLQDVAVVTYESEDAATRAVRMMDGTNMPSGRTMHVTFAPLPGLPAVHSAPADLAPAGANGEGVSNTVTNSVTNNSSMPFSTAGFGGGAGFDIFGGDAAAAAAMASANLQSGMFGGQQGWNAGAAARPPFASSIFGADLNSNTRGASWDGSGIAAANAAAAAGRPPMPGFFGGRGQQQQQQFGGVTGRHSISGPPSGSTRAVSPVGGMPPVYMASPVPSMPGGVGAGASPSPGGSNLFARPGSVGNGLGGNAGLMAAGNAADMSPFGLHAGGIGGLGAEFGYGSAGAAVSDALLELSEEASRMHQQQQQGGMGGVTNAGMSNAWGSLAGWDGGVTNVMRGVGNAAGPAAAAAAAAAGAGTSEGQGSSRSSSVAGGSQGRLSGLNDGAGVSAATAGSDSTSSLTGAGSS
jgi:hypothetical protein